jgi:HSP20 family protein
MDLLTQGMTQGYVHPPAGVFPLTNATEDKENYYVRAELPGLKAADLDIHVTGNSLSIAGERKIPEEKKNAKYHRRERESGTFSRMITLPGQINTAKVQATCVDGVLTVTLPKAADAKPKQISVKSK